MRKMTNVRIDNNSVQIVTFRQPHSSLCGVRNKLQTMKQGQKPHKLNSPNLNVQNQFLHLRLKFAFSRFVMNFVMPLGYWLLRTYVSTAVNSSSAVPIMLPNMKYISPEISLFPHHYQYLQKYMEQIITSRF